MLFAVTLLVVAAFADDCVEPVPGSPLDNMDIPCEQAIAAQGCDFDGHNLNAALPVGSYLWTYCPCSCPDGANSDPVEDPCADVCDNTALSTCMESCGAAPDVCGAPGGACNEDLVAYQGCLAGCQASSETTSDPATGDDSDCAACSSEEDAAGECVASATQCVSPCMGDSESACLDCVADQCGSKYKDYTDCYVDECVTGTYDVYRVASYCGSDCTGDCTPMEAMAVTFGSCYNDMDDDGFSSWSAVCNSDGSTVTLSEYDSLNCAGTPTTQVLTNGECPEGSDVYVKEEWFGGCGGADEWSSTNALFTVFAFVLSAMLY